MNSMMLFISELPSSQGPNAKKTSLGLSSTTLSDFNSTLYGMSGDLNGALNTGQTVVGTTGTTPTQDLLGSVIVGVSKGVCSVPLVGIGCSALSLAGIFLKFLGYLFFGYLIWIDLFIPSMFGLQYIGFIFKIVFFVVTVKGMTDILLPIFGWGRWGK